MSEFPVVKGWKPFKSIALDIDNNDKKIKKEKEKENYKNKVDQCEGLSVPKDWKTPSFKFEDNPHKRLFALSEFKVLFSPKLAVYLKEAFPIAQKAIEEHFIKAQLILNEGEMIVTTTRKTFDPVMILRAHGVIKLLSRYVPVEEAIKVLEDDVSEDIINIGHRNKETFTLRKKRLAEPSIVALISEVLECKIFIRGKTVAAIGSYNNLDKVRGVVQDCFQKNIHPIFTLKRLQVINKLKSMPEMEGKDWSKYLPPIPKRNVKRKKPHKVNIKKEYEAFPPAPIESQVDKDIAAGTFHLKYQKKDGKGFYRKIENEKTKEEEKKKIKKEAKVKVEEEVVENKKRKNTDSDDKTEQPAKKTKSSIKTE